MSTAKKNGSKPIKLPDLPKHLKRISDLADKVSSGDMNETMLQYGLRAPYSACDIEIKKTWEKIELK